MVYRSKRKKSKARKSALRVRGGFVPPMAFKPYMKYFSPFVEKIVREQANKIGTMTLNDVGNTIGKMKLPDAVTIGKTAVGVVSAFANGAVNNGHAEGPFIETNTTAKRIAGSSEYNMKKYKTNFNVGRPSTRSVERYAALNGTSKEVTFDTEFSDSYAAGSTNRSLLSVTSGFNQKSVTAFFPLHYSNGDWETQFDLNNLNYTQGSMQRIYGLAKYFWQRIKIMNTGSFFASKVTIKLYAAKDIRRGPGESVDFALPSATELANNTPTDAIPLKYALSGFANDAVKSYGLIDPKASLDDSPDFSRNWEFARAFHKTLKPGEVWDFTYKHHCGPGIRLDMVKELASSVLNSCAGYLMIVELHGVPCEGVNRQDEGESFIGTSPAWIQCELQKGHCSVLRSEPQFAAAGLNGGIVTSAGQFQIKAFIDNDYFDGSFRRHNFNIDQIDERGVTGAGIFIPVMSDTSLKFAGDSREQTP